MTTSTQAHNADERPLWQFDLLGNYQAPGLPTYGAIANAWHSVRQAFRPSDNPAHRGVEQQPDLHALSPRQVDQFLPMPGAKPLAAALQLTLASWLDHPAPDSPARFVIGQPGTGNDRILEALADNCGATVVAPPTSRQILAADTAWLDDWPVDRLWVLPNLEACFLRHTRGISPVRHFLDRLISGHLGRGIIGCDSWAWAYVQMLWPVTLPALTLQAFDAGRLYRLLEQLIPSGDQPLHLHQASNDKRLLTVAVEQNENPADNPELINQAAQSRGNPFQALLQWRARVRGAPEPAGEDLKSTPPRGGHGTVLWLADAPEEPVIPTASREEHLLMLHTLLLHGGVETDLLEALLPFSDIRCRALLGQAHRSGLVSPAGDGKWRVTDEAYRVVCQHLRGHQYLIDHFQRAG